MIQNMWLAPRPLSPELLDLVLVPPHFREARAESVPTWKTKCSTPEMSLPFDEVIHRYLSKLQPLVDGGYGLVLCGANGTGKTMAAVAVLLEVLRRGKTVLFVGGGDIRTYAIEKTLYSEQDDVTIWDRAHEVDFLLLDDLGKTQDSKGFGVELVDRLIRSRAGQHRATWLTTNFSFKELPLGLKPSTISLLKECALIYELEGSDLRTGNPMVELMGGSL